MNPIESPQVRLAGLSASPNSGGCLAYGVESAAKLLGVGRTTVFELIRTGKLKAVKLGGRTLIPDAALRDFVASLPAIAA